MSGPRPVVTVDSEPFWDHVRRREFRVQRCSACGASRLPPSPVCRHCWSTQSTWEALSGRGTVQSWVVYRRQYLDAFPTPYAVVLVELEEGLRFEAGLLDCDPSEIWRGMDVELVFVSDDDHVLPQFRPRTAVPTSEGAS